MGNVDIGETEELFSFKTSVPPHLPATWEGKYGTVRYIAKVMIKEQKKPIQVFTQEIPVCPKRNLQLEQHLLCEARQDISRNFRYGIINLGNIYISMWLPLCGIAAGQGIPLLCTINNESTVQFGGLIFVLTQLQVYRSLQPTKATKVHRHDVCRIPRMVDILQGKYEFYCVLQTNHDLYPTNQFWKCKCCQVIYEVWVSLQGAIPRYKAYGYPNIDSPGIPLIIGTEPLCEWDNKLLTNDVMESVFSTRPPVIMEPLPPDDDIEEMLNNADEELDYETERNLSRQLVDEPMFQINDEDDDTLEEVKSDEDVTKNNRKNSET
ncbi:hypothetical protein ILUMI_20614 [Ignelater luminosus]|uniref:Uncharacterized protein n=1 Tax=Ignelater luminosus TaxID=2038154 RepID=A0A8K0CH38_IGNLU|nr:hypothetical protein ILUMI_20614 [Ignelater luminosus]